jgi:hypothetical protein
MLFFRRVVLLGTSTGREMARMKAARHAPGWVDTVPSSFNIQYRLVCWPSLPEEHRTAGILRALSRMTVENFDYPQMADWTGLGASHSRALFELCLTQGWIKPALLAEDFPR